MILFDTGPIVAAANTRDRHHEASVRLFTQMRLAGEQLLLPSTVAAEVGYLLTERVQPRIEIEFIRGVAEGAFEPVDLEKADYVRMAELAEQYVDFPLGLTDASVVAIAERLGITEIATLDREHFSAVRPRHVDYFTLLPEML